MKLFSKKKVEQKFTRIIFATDLHGSEKTFMKFVNGAKIYKANVAILGGDITGKLIIPIVEQPDGSYTANFLGTDVKVKTKQEMDELEKLISFSGYYPYKCSEKKFEELQAYPEKVKALFTKLMVENIRKWVKIIENRLKPLGIKCYITGGNDDCFEIDSALRESDYVINPEGQVVYVDDQHEMISTGYGNPTPWKCPRDISEEELAKKIEVVASQVEDIKNCIFNLHVPPKNSGLDTVVKLDTSVSPPKPVLGETASAGSIAVRRSIERFQPLLGLHGHIHESRGVIKIGRTICINPGSEYGEGILRAVLINLDRDCVKSYQFIQG